MKTRKQKICDWILAVVMLAASLLFLFPVIWMAANSFKTDAAITRDMNSLAAFIPPALNGNFFDNYITVLTNTSFLKYTVNTLFDDRSYGNNHYDTFFLYCQTKAAK